MAPRFLPLLLAARISFAYNTRAGNLYINFFNLYFIYLFLSPPLSFTSPRYTLAGRLSAAAFGGKEAAK